MATNLNSDQLQLAYHPAEPALDVALTLRAETDAQPAPHHASQDWSVPPAGAGPVLRRIVRLSRRLQLA